MHTERLGMHHAEAMLRCHPYLSCDQDPEQEENLQPSQLCCYVSRAMGKVVPSIRQTSLQPTTYSQKPSTNTSSILFARPQRSRQHPRCWRRFSVFVRYILSVLTKL